MRAIWKSFWRYLKPVMETSSKVSEDLSTYPNAAWDLIKSQQTVNLVKPLDPKETPITPDKVRFVCVSDTHTRAADMLHSVPDGDVLLHSGDFTQKGTLEEAEEFNEWLGTLPHPHKVVISGNHEVLFDPDAKDNHKPANPLDVLTNVTAYLCDSSTVVYGLKIYGAPWSPIYHIMAFNLERGAPLREKWSYIPNDVDILMTHCPAMGYGDLSWRQERSGCVDLLKAIQTRIKPKYHVFGHIHEGYGMTNDGLTTYINASTCNLRYEPVNAPIIFDVPLPQGYEKTSKATLE